MSYNTEKRNNLLRFLRENSQNSFTVDELCNNVLNGEGGKSTIYRLVSKLCAEGALRKIFNESTKKISYQYLDCEHCHEHLHLKCKNCGKLIHLDENASQILENSLLQSRGFEIDEGAMLFGRCIDCRGGKNA